MNRQITRVTSRNRAAIESDARAGLPDDTAIDVTNGGLLLVNSGLFAGTYRIVKVNGPRWIGDNGYTFVRATEFGDLVLNGGQYDYAGVQTVTEARVRHFLRLVEQFKLDADQLASGLSTVAACQTIEELRSIVSAIDPFWSGAAVAEFTDAVEAREALIRKLDQLSTAKHIRIKIGADSFEITEALTLEDGARRLCGRNVTAEAFEANGDVFFTSRGRGWYFSNAFRSFLIDDAAKRITLDRILTELDRRAEALARLTAIEPDHTFTLQTPAAVIIEAATIAEAREAYNRAPAASTGAARVCERCGAIGAIERRIELTYDNGQETFIERCGFDLCDRCAAFADSVGAIDADQFFAKPYSEAVAPAAPIDYDPVFAAASSETELTSIHADIDFAGMTPARIAYVNASYENALDRVRRAPVVAEAAAKRQRVIDRALETGRRYEDDQIDQYPLLREVATDYIRSYRGTNGFVQNLAVKLVDYGRLSSPQLRGALNVMVAEARIERANRAPVAPRATTGQYLASMDAAEARSGIDRSASDDDFRIDLRRQSDRQIEDAGEALPPAAEAANEVAPAIPNGFYTVIIDAAGTYRTLRVGECPDYFTVKPGTQLISFLNGPDNTSDYKGFAFLAGRKVSIWSKFKTADALRQAADMLVADPMTGASEYVKRSNRCFVCNRPLTTPESIARGIGPICAEAIGALGYSFEKSPRTSGAEAALKRARERQAADGPITLAQAQTDMDELFD